MLPPTDRAHSAGRDSLAAAISPPLAESLPSSRTTARPPPRPLPGMQLHFGPRTALTPDPPIAAIDSVGGNLEISIRNNSSGIQTYHLEPAGQGMEFLPSILAADERR